MKVDSKSPASGSIKKVRGSRKRRGEQGRAIGCIPLPEEDAIKRRAVEQTLREEKRQLIVARPAQWAEETVDGPASPAAIGSADEGRIGQGDTEPKQECRAVGRQEMQAGRIAPEARAEVEDRACRKAKRHPLPQRE